VHSKLQDFLKKYAALQKQNTQQQQLIAELKVSIEENKNKIRQLEEQQHILKSAVGKMNETDKKAYEQIIGKYIKELDKCIALLSE
jgi:phage shock protein A